jgi:hypothetical protein
LPNISQFNMPNKRDRHKLNRTGKPATGVSKTPPGLSSVKDVLARQSVALTQLTRQSTRQYHWQQWLTDNLPAALVQHVSGVVEREGALVIFAESAAWSARLRFAIHELETQIRAAQPAIQQVSVRVMPKN